MIIKNIYTDMQLIDGNKLRIKNINSVDIYKKQIRMIEILNLNDHIEIKEFLQNEVFFEIIGKEFISNLQNTYNSLFEDKKIQIVDDLIKSYKIRGLNGVRFSWTPIIERYKY